MLDDSPPRIGSVVVGGEELDFQTIGPAGFRDQLRVESIGTDIQILHRIHTTRRIGPPSEIAQSPTPRVLR